MDYRTFISDAEIEQVRKPLEQASFLPPRLYHGEEFYRFETEKIFMKTWLPLAHVSELAEVNTYVTRKMFGEPVIITRNSNGEIQTFSNVCRHRTAQIVTGNGKFNQPSNTISCPYHAWAYSPDGELVGAPRMHLTEGFDKAKCPLPKMQTEVWQGFIFVNFDREAPPLGPQLETLEKVLAPFEMDKLVVSELASYPVRWNWKVTLENFTEGYHQPSVHANSIEPFLPSHQQQYDDVDGPYNLFYMPTATAKPLFDLVPPLAGLPPELYEKMVVVNIFPLFHLLIDAGVIFWLDWEPRGASDHDIRWRVLVPAETAAMADFEVRKLAMGTLMKGVWDEDNESCNNVNAGVQSRFASIGRPAYLEKSVHQFQNWLVDRYTA